MNSNDNAPLVLIVVYKVKDFILQLVGIKMF